MADKVFFTGSTATGRAVAMACARRLKGCVLELGGKDAMLVLDDADLDRSVDGAVWGAFVNAGQMCTSVERIYVHHSHYEEFTARLARRASALVVGDGSVPGTDVGPLVDGTQLEHVEALVAEAVAAGATVRCGGRRATVEGLAGGFYAPTVLTDVPAGARIATEEAFGPVVTVAPFGSDDQAIDLANSTAYGLGASVWTADAARAGRIAGALAAGMVWTNDVTYSYAAGQAPWGGVRDSGLGRSHARQGLLECVQVKYADEDPARLRQPWWMPYGEESAATWRTAIDVLYGPSLRARAGAAVAGRRDLIRLARAYFRP
jgi:succinate-semialdehyde dehydrogenase/glutarate-semialdehyde dehydrogenase